MGLIVFKLMPLLAAFYLGPIPTNNDSGDK